MPDKTKPTHPLKEIEIMVGALDQYRMCKSARELVSDINANICHFLEVNEHDNGGNEWFIVTGRIYGEDEAFSIPYQAWNATDARARCREDMSEDAVVTEEGPGYIYLDKTFHCGIVKPLLQ